MLSAVFLLQCWMIMLQVPGRQITLLVKKCLQTVMQVGQRGLHRLALQPTAALLPLSEFWMASLWLAALSRELSLFPKLQAQTPSMVNHSEVH